MGIALITGLNDMNQRLQKTLENKLENATIYDCSCSADSKFIIETNQPIWWGLNCKHGLFFLECDGVFFHAFPSVDEVVETIKEVEVIGVENYLDFL